MLNHGLSKRAIPTEMKESDQLADERTLLGASTPDAVIQDCKNDIVHIYLYVCIWIYT